MIEYRTKTEGEVIEQERKKKEGQGSENAVKI